MIKIVIVDDENITRQWIRRKIEEMGAEYTIAGEFANGRMALEYCKNHSVDVLFTDICMPNMDGMELLRGIGELGICMYKVILSAYDQFDYVREALKLGVHEFLLKPEITNTKLKEILNAAKEYLISHADEKSNKAQEENLWKRFLECGSNYTEAQICAQIEKQHIKLENKNLVVISILSDKPEAIKEVPAFFELYKEEQRINGVCFLMGTGECTIIYNQRNDNVRLKMAEALYRILQIHLGMKPYIGISCRQDGFVRLMDLQRQALQARENRFFFHITGCQMYDALKIEKDGELYYNNDRKEICRLIEKEDYTEADNRAEVLLEKLKTAVFLPSVYVKSICNEIIMAYIHRLWNYSLSAEEISRIKEIELVLGSNEDKFEMLYQRTYQAQKYLSSVLIRKNEKKQYSKPIQEIMNYVEKHYQNKIMMEDIADNIHLSRTYISVLFKKETGENFSDYLQRIRLEKASTLLKDTKKSIQEIAEKVGFFDAAHFNRAFKSYYKCSPNEYRKKSGIK